jgi:hypothetical protein
VRGSLNESALVVGDRQRSDQLNYIPTLFSYPYRKPAFLVAFLRFRPGRSFQPHRTELQVIRHQAKSPSNILLQVKTNPEPRSLPVN